MLCNTCGRQAQPHARFCARCGAPLQPQARPWPTDEGDVRVSPYYAQEFANITAGNPPRFNMAAFFLGPFHMLHHGQGKRFCLLYLPYYAVLLLWCTSLGVQACKMAQMLCDGADVLKAMPAFLPSWLFTAALALWGIGLAVYNGATFNYKFYHHAKGNPTVRPRVGWVVAFGAVLLAFCLLFFIALTGTVLHSFLHNIGVLAPTATEGASQDSAPAYDDTVAQILQDYASAADQAVYNGYVPAEWQGGDVPRQVENAFLFYSDTLPLGEVLQAVPHSIEDTGINAQGNSTARVVCTVGETQLNLLFVMEGPYFGLTNLYTRRLNGPVDNVYWMNESEITSVMLYLYAQAAPGEASTLSLARRIRGTWVNQASGQAVLLDSQYFGDVEYQLANIDDGWVQAFVFWYDAETGNLATYEAYWFGLDDDNRTLTVEIYGADGALLSTEVYTRSVL